MSKSNLNGRLLEYYIVKELLNNTSSSLSEHSKIDQIRDEAKIMDISNSLNQTFLSSSKRLKEWVKGKINLDGAVIIRHTDDSGVEGDVSDITIVNSKTDEKLNLSIKHNHLALKHQRPPSTPQQLGIPKNSTEDIRFRKDLDNILNEFQKQSKLLNPNVKLFSEVVQIVPSKLYTPVCKLICDLINKYGNDSTKSDHYMKFLIGNTDYTKVVVIHGEIQLSKYQDLPASTSMKAELISDKNIIVDFNNGVVVNMRLHTASSRIETNSLKFDTQPQQLNVPHEVLTF